MEAVQDHSVAAAEWIKGILRGLLEKSLALENPKVVLTKDGAFDFIYDHEDPPAVKRFQFGNSEAASAIREVIISLGGLKPFEGIKQKGSFSYGITEGNFGQAFDIEFESDPEDGLLYLMVIPHPLYPGTRGLALNVVAPAIAFFAGVTFLQLPIWLFLLIVFVISYRGLAINPYWPLVKVRALVRYSKTAHFIAFAGLAGGMFKTGFEHRITTWDFLWGALFIATAVGCSRLNLFQRLQTLLWGRKK